jgi:hypothetical protein
VSAQDPAMGFDFYNLLPGGASLEHWIHADADAAYQTLDRRWTALLAWDPERKVPQAIPMVRSWRAFADRWQSLGGAVSGQDRDGLREQAMNLQTAEGNAQLKGYSNPPDVPALTAAEMAPRRGAPMTPPLIHTPSVEDNHPLAAAVDRMAPGGSRKPGDPPPDPLLVPKALGVGAMVLGTIVAAATAKKDSARVGIAVGGLVVSGLTGWLAFRPDDAPPEKKGT